MPMVPRCFAACPEEMLTSFNFQRAKDINDWGIFRRLCHEHALMTNLTLGWCSNVIVVVLVVDCCWLLVVVGVVVGAFALASPKSTYILNWHTQSGAPAL